MKKHFEIEKKETSSSPTANIINNLKYAREWYKRVRPSKNIQFKVQNSGSAQAGSVKNALLSLTFVPEWEDNWPVISRAIPTFVDELDFRGELDRVYRLFQEHIAKMEDKKQKGILKPRPKGSENGPSFGFKRLK